MMTFKPFDVVELPFPFSDLSRAKMRKALVVSSQTFNEMNNAVTVAMITSRANSEWLGDVPIQHWALAGLKKPCYVRLKFFTADTLVFTGKVGELNQIDQKKVMTSFRTNLMTV